MTCSTKLLDDTNKRNTRKQKQSNVQLSTYLYYPLHEILPPFYGTKQNLTCLQIASLAQLNLHQDPR